jgi:branched-chain amino acid:cation transporter, LIVCS family
MKTGRIISSGFAMFAMLFGAGNVVFPLIVGKTVGNQLLFGTLGFVATAVIVPLVGLISTMLYDGNYKNFLGRIGTIPGNIVIFLCMILIGPFAMTPRCITISQAQIELYMPQFTIFYFSIFIAALTYLCTRKKGQVAGILGKFLGPIKITLLLAIIIKGLFSPYPLIDVALTKGQGFLEGFFTGYNTVDLLGGIFFSGLVLSGLRCGLPVEDSHNYKKIALAGLYAGIIGGTLMGLVYTGFLIVSAFHATALQAVPDQSIFSVLSKIVLGGYGGFLANMTVAISCFATTIALTTVFTEYLQKELLQNKIGYKPALITTIAITSMMSNLGFGGIMKLATPVIFFIYPSLIVLAFANAAHKLFGFKPVKIPVFVTLLVTAYFKLFW